MKRRQANDGEKLVKCVFGCCVPSVSPIRFLVLFPAFALSELIWLSSFKCVNLLKFFFVIAVICLILQPLFSSRYIFLKMLSFQESWSVLLDKDDLMWLLCGSQSDKIKTIEAGVPQYHFFLPDTNPDTPTFSQ